MNKRIRMVIISVVLICSVSLLTYEMLNTFGNVYISVDSVTENPDSYMGRTLQVKGNLQPGSLSITSENVTFVIAGENSTLNVILIGQVPDMIDGQEIVAIGSLQSATLLRATQILVKCPSKYETTTT